MLRILILAATLAFAAIAQATEGKDFAEIARLLELLRHPFEEQPGMEQYAASPPRGTPPVIVSCSS